MKYIITQHDKDLLLQCSVEYAYKLYVLDKNEKVVDELTSLQSIGSYTIDADSKTRRTTSFVMYLGDTFSNIEKKLFQWIGLTFELQIGIRDLRTDEFTWYKCGYYLITESNTTYNAVDNSISTNLADWYAKLDGTRNGQIGGAPTISIPNLDENGNIITIRQATIGLIKSETDLKKYIIDDIGQFYGMPENNINYVQYRKDNPNWNQLPYDLEYECGCTVGSILTEIEELYPNCKMYFDVYNNFCFCLIPSCEYDPIVLDNSYIQKILVGTNSESVSYNISNIKNVTEVFGVNYEIDRYSESCSLSSNVYTLTLDGYEEYSTTELIAFVPNAINVKNTHVKINSLADLPLYYEYTTDFVAEGTLLADNTYVIQIKKVNGSYVAYYLGQYQPHAICVLSNDASDSVYTKSYFAKKYNCNINNVRIRIEEDSPFAVQKLGEILDVKYGDDFNNILSDSVALENATYYNRQSSSVYDTITLSTIMIPFLDVDSKIEYQKQQDDKTHEYIVKSIINNIESNTSSIVMYRFYPLYYV